MALGLEDLVGNLNSTPLPLACLYSPQGNPKWCYQGLHKHFHLPLMINIVISYFIINNLLHIYQSKIKYNHLYAHYIVFNHIKYNT